MMAESHSLASAVANFYNNLEEKGIESRTESRILYMRNFNNWVKSVLIGEARRHLDMDEKIVVMDLGCGKGGDLPKWDKSSVGKIVLSDIAEKSLEQCKNRFESRNRSYEAEFILADATRDTLRDKLKDKEMMFDIVSCQFMLHYSFESLRQANKFLQNVASNLRPGGFFIGTTTDGFEIMRRLKEVNSPSEVARNGDESEAVVPEDKEVYKLKKFGNSIYSVEFPEDAQLSPPPLFGSKYNFHLEGVVDCPEFLVYFPTLQRLAKAHNLELIMKSRFEDFVQRNISKERDLLNRIDSLERYPSQNPVGNAETDYNHVKKPEYEKMTVGTLSKDEWEAMTMYCVFIFKKNAPEEAGL
ncbi:mRNA cap guanine-N7 methyltransferase-like [Artemia franciscana]|uniref:mRNA cap guanine-N7 methyltransferase-like n=1 Tax=Artemia franciscana TaxID=6661 RepID=UPI0032D9DCFE